MQQPSLRKEGTSPDPIWPSPPPLLPNQGTLHVPKLEIDMVYPRQSPSIYKTTEHSQDPLWPSFHSHTLTL
jgi:hypothetical protein